MAIKKILRMGDQRLLKVSESIKDITAEQMFLTQLYEDMFDSVLSKETEAAVEECLSVPGIRGSVRRFTQIHYTDILFIMKK